MKLQAVSLYGVLLVVTFLLLAMVWHWQMASTYFLCKHHGLILDFLPPFVHQGEDGDVYLKPQAAVYSMWALYVIAGLALPAICAWLFLRLCERDLQMSWR
jgi:hypothetical protein